MPESGIIGLGLPSLTRFCGVDGGDQRKLGFGEVPERLNGAASKSVVRLGLIKSRSSSKLAALGRSRLLY